MPYPVISNPLQIMHMPHEEKPLVNFYNLYMYIKIVIIIFSGLSMLILFQIIVLVISEFICSDCIKLVSDSVLCP